ncbi:MAG: hypothetical protein MHMPM18_004382 [Marteilia pararefringens]
MEMSNRQKGGSSSGSGSSSCAQISLTSQQQALLNLFTSFRLEEENQLASSRIQSPKLNSSTSSNNKNDDLLEKDAGRDLLNLKIRNQLSSKIKNKSDNNEAKKDAKQLMIDMVRSGKMHFEKSKLNYNVDGDKQIHFQSSNSEFAQLPKSAINSQITNSLNKENSRISPKGYSSTDKRSNSFGTSIKNRVCQSQIFEDSKMFQHFKKRKIIQFDDVLE